MAWVLVHFDRTTRQLSGFHWLGTFQTQALNSVTVSCRPNDGAGAQNEYEECRLRNQVDVVRIDGSAIVVGVPGIDGDVRNHNSLREQQRGLDSAETEKNRDERISEGEHCPKGMAERRSIAVE